MRLNQGAVFILLVTFGVLVGCKKKPAALKSRPLACSESNGGEGAWSRVILPDEITGRLGVSVPLYFFSDGQRLGMYSYNHWAEMQPGSWDWKVGAIESDRGSELTDAYGAMSPTHLIVQHGFDSYTREDAVRLDVLNFGEMKWETVNNAQFFDFSYGIQGWTGDSFVIWPRVLYEGEGREQRYVSTTFDGYFFDPVSRELTPISAPRSPYSAENAERFKERRSLYTIWAGERLYAWGVDPSDGLVWGFYLSKSTNAWLPFNVNGAPSHGGRFDVVYDENDAIYYVGGVDPRTDDYIYLREVWRYTISTDSWDEIKVPEWVDPLDGVWMEGKLYVFGQCAAGASYDPKSDSWTQLPPGNLPGTGKVYTAGGRIMIGYVVMHHPSSLPYVWIYDPSGEQAPADAGQSIGWGGSRP